METKRVTENFYERNTSDCDPDTIKVTLNSIETLFEECDTKLTNAEMSPSNYESQELQIGIMRNNLLTLQLYVADAYNEVYNELDKPLCNEFQNGATHTLSNIVLSEIETKNTFNMEEHIQFNDSSGTYYLKEVKKSVTMADFLGLAAVEPGEGAPVLENMETIGIFTMLFRMDYQNSEAAGASVEQLMGAYLYAGEYSHKKNEPVKEFVSGLLDITIVKPFVECVIGKDLITGEKLSDYEMAMKFVGVAIGVLTFGQGTVAIDAAGLIGKEAFVTVMRTWAVDAAADAAAYTVGYVCDELGLPQEAVILASLLTGCTVSVTASKKYLFVDSAGKEVMECTPEEVQKLLKNGETSQLEGGSVPGVYTDKIKWGIHEIEVRPDGNGFWGQRIRQNNPRVEGYELKINPQNESYYLPHPEGGYVQFENMINSTVQDGKLVMQQKSFYHVNDMPDFAKNKVLEEARRQIDAAGAADYKVEWLVSDESAVNQLTEFFKEQNVDIIVTFYPE